MYHRDTSWLLGWLLEREMTGMLEQAQSLIGI